MWLRAIIRFNARKIAASLDSGLLVLNQNGLFGAWDCCEGHSMLAGP